MPEIAEVARVVHFLRRHLVGKRVLKVSAQDDANVFGKAGTSGAQVADALKGKKVVSAGSQGKYFWLVLNKPPHLVMHLGMTGWVHIRGVKSAYTNYYKKMKPGEEELWPPKYAKLELETEGPEKAEIAYTDPRRFGRIRLVDCPGEDIRQHSPLFENGPDPVVDVDVFTEEYFAGKLRSRHVPVKALLLDQAFISGIGNWVGDEVLYQARLHPEQYANEFNDAEVKRLYEAICSVCRTAVEKLGDSDEFPKDWLFNHRWGKGTKSSQLPNGEKLAFVTVGGRTSCYAPRLQKKTGNVPSGIKEEPLVPDATKKRAKSGAAKTKDPEVAETSPAAKRRRISRQPKQEGSAAEPVPAEITALRGRRKPAVKSEKPSPEDTTQDSPAITPDTGRRRSGRLQGRTGP